MTLPTFIIAGAPKCGTTALWSFLKGHPEVYLPERKEPRFFTRTEHFMENGIERPGPDRFVNFNRGIGWYNSLYEPGKYARTRGEASTLYFSAPDSAYLIKSFIPDVRLIFILRDPVERMYSHYREDCKSGFHYPGFEQMVDENHPAFRYYAYVSQYRRHLERFFSQFETDRILVLLDRDLKNQPRRIFCKVCGFIGVDPGHEPDFGITYNPYFNPRIRAVERFLTLFRHSSISQKIPDRVRCRLRLVRAFITRINSSFDGYSPLAPEVRSRLVGLFEKDIAYVEKLLKVQLDSWRM